MQSKGIDEVHYLLFTRMPKFRVLKEISDPDDAFMEVQRGLAQARNRATQFIEPATILYYQNAELGVMTIPAERTIIKVE